MADPTRRALMAGIAGAAVTLPGLSAFAGLAEDMAPPVVLHLTRDRALAILEELKAIDVTVVAQPPEGVLYCFIYMPLPWQPQRFDNDRYEALMAEMDEPNLRAEIDRIVRRRQWGELAPEVAPHA